MGDRAADDLDEVLGISSSASEAELRAAWRTLAMRWHPDRSGKDTTHIFRKLLDA